MWVVWIRGLRDSGFVVDIAWLIVDPCFENRGADLRDTEASNEHSEGINAEPSHVAILPSLLLRIKFPVTYHDEWAATRE